MHPPVVRVLGSHPQRVEMTQQRQAKRRPPGFPAGRPISEYTQVRCVANKSCSCVGFGVDVPSIFSSFFFLFPLFPNPGRTGRRQEEGRRHGQGGGRVRGRVPAPARLARQGQRSADLGYRKPLDRQPAPLSYHRPSRCSWVWTCRISPQPGGVGGQQWQRGDLLVGKMDLACLCVRVYLPWHPEQLPVVGWLVAWVFFCYPSRPWSGGFVVCLAGGMRCACEGIFVRVTVGRARIPLNSKSSVSTATWF